MPEAISNTSPLVYLYRIGAIDWLPHLFSEVWIPDAVRGELKEGLRKGFDVLDPDFYQWLKIVNPQATPSEWLSLDLGAGELAAMALALENPTRIILLDDLLARRTAQAAGLMVWGTLRGFTRSEITRTDKRDCTPGCPTERIRNVVVY